MANEHTQVLDDLVQAVSGHKPPSRRGWRDAAALVLAVIALRQAGTASDVGLTVVIVGPMTVTPTEIEPPVPPSPFLTWIA